MAEAESAEVSELGTRVVSTNIESIQNVLGEVIQNMWIQLIQHIPLLVIGFILFVATWCITKGVQFALKKVLQKRNIRKSLIELIIRLVGILLWMLGLLIIGTVIFPGLTPASALGGLGLFSLAVGFAFKDIFENFFAGMLMLWRFPFENGDHIECEGLEGEVVDVSMRQTLLRKTSGEIIIIPNAFLFKNPVEVVTHKPERRVILMVGIAYAEDIENAVDVIKKALSLCKTIKSAYPVQIFPQAFGESSIDIEVAWWTGARPLEVRQSRAEVVTAIKKALDQANIEIPFPYRTLTFKPDSGLKIHQTN
jgi:small-conductance mechanosensitive channel